MRFGANWIFKDLSLQIWQGEHLALLGANGSGKSTLLRLMAGELRLPQDDTGQIAWGFAGQMDASPLLPKKHARLVSPLQHHNYVRRGWRISGQELILSGLDNAMMLYGQAEEELCQKVHELAEKIAQSKLLALQVPAMSQGQLRLILILRALISEPKLLLLDEPFEGLDKNARAKVLSLLDLAVGGDCTVVLSAHRAVDIPSWVKERATVKQGKIHLWQEVLEKESTVTSLPKLPSGAKVEGTLLDYASQPIDTAETLWPIPRDFSAPRDYSASAKSAVLELREVDVFIERQQVLFDISWKVGQGENWVVCGANGSGKSTLLRLLYGEEFAAFGGTILWYGEPRPALEVLHQRVGFVADSLQHLYTLETSGEQVVLSGFWGSFGVFQEPSFAQKSFAAGLIDFFALGEFAHLDFASLSTGLARRFLLARALACKPKILLLDEPCSGLDPASRQTFLQALEMVAGQGVQLVYVSHHLDDVPECCQQVLHLEQGRVVFQGKKGNF